MNSQQSEPVAKRNAESRTYQPFDRFSDGPFLAIKRFLAEIARHRSHISTVFIDDFKAGYRGTALGVFWNFVLPLVPVSVYILLVNLRVFPTFEGMNPALYIGFNVTLWVLFTGMITRPIQVVKSRNAETMMTALPMSAAIVASFAQLCFDTLVRGALVVLLVVVFGQWPNVAIFDLLLALMFATMFCFSIGLTLSILSMIFSDIARLVAILLQYGIFVSGVIFPVSTMGPLAVLETTNPFNVIISASRDAIFAGGYAHTPELLVWTGASSLLMLVSINFFYIMEHRIRGVV